MKKLYLWLLMITTVLVGCEKSESDIITIPDGKECRLISLTSKQNGFQNNGLFFYNSSGYFLYSKSFLSGGDTTTGYQYEYLGDILQYSFFNQLPTFYDTAFYFYDNQNRLESLIHRTLSDSVLSIYKMDYFYNSDNKVIYTVSRETINSIILHRDSSVYQYTGNNITKFTQYTNLGTDSLKSTVFLLTYDNMKNFYKTEGRPATDFFFWSESNIVQIKYADSTNFITTNSYTKYNASGYPTEYTTTTRQSIYDVVLIYQCE